MDRLLPISKEEFQKTMSDHLKQRTYETPLFQLRDIPSVMRSRMGWIVAAKLMDRWFNGSHFEMPTLMKESKDSYQLSRLSPFHLDETTVTMGWAMSFKRVQLALETLKKQWNSPAGVMRLKKIVEAPVARQPMQQWRFGNLAQPAKILHDTCQVNYLVFGKWGDPLDDFYGAMGESQMNIAVSGMVTPMESGKFSIDIDELGFYLRDSYEFNDAGKIRISQPLGCWGFQGVSCWGGGSPNIHVKEVKADISPKEAQKRKYFVQNKYFREWRLINKKGGDFMVLSDVKRISLTTPLKISW